jgi:hypothetical protein
MYEIVSVEVPVTVMDVVEAGTALAPVAVDVISLATHP